MSDLPYSLEPVSGYDAYKVTSMLRDYLELQMEDPENRTTIDQVMKWLDDYIIQLKNLKKQNKTETKEHFFIFPLLSLQSCNLVARDK